jgi:hypothetical protein
LLPGNPYGPRAPSLCVGIAFRHNIGEDDGDGALAAVRAAIRNGWGPSEYGRARCYVDRGIGPKGSFARGILQLGYRPCISAEEPDRQLPILGKRVLKPARASRGPVMGGPEVFRGVWVCCQAGLRSRFPNLIAPDPEVATDEDLAAHQDIVDEISRYQMVENRRPVVDVSDPNPRKWTTTFELECPHVRRRRAEGASARESHGEAPCPLIARYSIPADLAKYTDAIMRASFEHEDAYSVNRSHNERPHAYYRRASMDGLRLEAVEVIGRVRCGMIISIAFAISNLDLIDGYTLEFASPNCMPLHRRHRERASRKKRIAAARAARPSRRRT